jgi:hypothetical protein
VGDWDDGWVIFCGAVLSLLAIIVNMGINNMLYFAVFLWALKDFGH